MYKIESFQTGENNFSWQLKSKNRKIIATSDSYTRKEMCLKTAKKLSKDLNCPISFINLTKDYEL